MQVTIIRPAPYAYQLPELSLYNSYAQTAQNKVEPEYVKISQLQVERLHNHLQGSADYILCSDSLRCQKTAVLLKQAFNVTPAIIVSPDFREIDYRMDEFITEREFQNLRSRATDVARKRFMKNFVHNELNTTFEEILLRVENCLKTISQLDARKILVVSSSFFMKVFEYVAVCKSKNEPILATGFLEFYDGKVLAYNFLSGFSFEIEKGIIKERKFL